MSEVAVATEENEPVKCNSCGTVNDPYPDNGLCVKCNHFLPGNRFRLPPGKNLQDRKKRIKKRARQYVEDQGLKWGEIDAITQDLALRAATTKNRHDSSLLLEQLGKRKAKPKADDPNAEAEIVIVMTGETVEMLEESLGVLDKLLQDS